MMANIRKSLIALLFGVIGGAATLLVYENLNSETQVQNQYQEDERPSADVHRINRMPNISGANSPEGGDFTQAAKKSLDAVVHVKTRNMDQGYRDPLEQFFRGPQQRRQREVLSAGSGVIVSSDGYIVTNNHVIQKASEIKVVLNDGNSYTAEVEGRDKATDLALLKVDGEELPTIEYGNSDQVQVGEWVLAVGNPFNLTSTVTAGIVSATGRNIDLRRRDPNEEFFPIESFIQTDAAVNPGNSGGALVDDQGRLVGINTAIASNTGSYTGYSFAIPSNIVQKVVRDLIEYGKVQRGFIGVQIRNISDALAEEKDLSQLKGVYVAGLMEDGAARAAGIQKEDIITSVGSVKVENVPQLQGQVSKYRPGDEVSVTVLRDGEEKEFSVTLRNEEGNVELIEASETEEVLRDLGAELQETPEEYKEKFGLDHGVQVQNLKDGKLRKAGVREGFIILQVDRKKVHSVEEVKSYLKENEGKGVLIGGVYPNGMKAYYGLGA